MSNRLPWYQWFPADARNDPGLASCSFHTRAVWRLLLDVMHESEERGYLIVNGKAMNAVQIAHAIGASSRSCALHINELETRGVFSRDERGAIYCRRMVRDERIRLSRAAGGKLGGNPVLVNQNTGAKVNHQTPPKVNLTPNLTPNPSSVVQKFSSSVVHKPPGLMGLVTPPERAHEPPTPEPETRTRGLRNTDPEPEQPTRATMPIDAMRAAIGQRQRQPRLCMEAEDPDPLPASEPAEYVRPTYEQILAMGRETPAPLTVTGDQRERAKERAAIRRAAVARSKAKRTGAP